MSEGIISGSKNRILQLMARFFPGATTLRVYLHRWRGVKIGKGVWIGYDAIIETSYPHLVTIEKDAAIGIRTTIIAHTRGIKPVTIKEGASIGPGAIILPNVTVGKYAIVTPGSVVTCTVPPMTVVQGNPARPVAQCGVPLTRDVTLKEFSKKLKPISSSKKY